MLSARHGLRAHYGLLAVHSLLFRTLIVGVRCICTICAGHVWTHARYELHSIFGAHHRPDGWSEVDLRLIWGWSSAWTQKANKKTRMLIRALSIGYWKIVYSKTSIPLWAGALFSSFISLLYRLGTSARRCLFINRGPTFGPRLENDSEHYLAAKYLLILLSKRCLLVEHAVAYGMCGILKRPVTGQSLPANRLLSSS